MDTLKHTYTRSQSSSPQSAHIVRQRRTTLYIPFSTIFLGQWKENWIVWNSPFGFWAGQRICCWSWTLLRHRWPSRLSARWSGEKEEIGAGGEAESCSSPVLPCLFSWLPLPLIDDARSVPTLYILYIYIIIMFNAS